MKFINRKQELERLEKVANLPDGGLAVVWGRRRVGKTRLLLEWASKHKGVYYTADESSPSLQRKYFALAIEQALPGFGSVDYSDWISLFNRLAKEAMYTEWRGPLIIDELPYLVASSPELPSVLQKFFDIDARRAKLVVALCGSSQHMMQESILNSSAPLYGRADEIIKLSPISVGYIGEALDLKHAKEEIGSYAVWGGVPKYWELVKNNGGTLLESIDSLVLDPMGPLNDEPNRLLQDEIPKAISLRPILDAIGFGAHRLSEIGTRIGQPVTSLGRSIQRLQEIDLVFREVPYGIHEHHSKRSLYKIKDPFIKFWFDIVASRRSHFAQLPSSKRLQWLKSNLNHFFSDAWKQICRESVALISREWKAPHFGQAGRYWHGKGFEWDILAKSIEDEALLIAEAKWTVQMPTKAWIDKTLTELKAKGMPPVPRPSNVKIYYALFVSQRPSNLRLPPDTQVIDAAQVIASFI